MKSFQPFCRGSRKNKNGDVIALKEHGADQSERIK